MIAVVDSSVVIKWFVEEEDSSLSLGLRVLPLLAPDLILAECANVFWKKIRKGELDAADASQALRILELSALVIEPSRGVAVRALELAEVLEHPAYDCFYLALAERRGLPVITADAKLAKAVGRKSTEVSVPIIMLSDWKVRLNVPG